MGRVDVAEGKVDTMKHETDVQKAVFAAAKDLVTYGMDLEKMTATLSSIAKDSGIPAMQSYAQAVKDHGKQDPDPDVAGDADGKNLPKELQIFANQGEGVLEKALKYSGEYDEAKNHGLKMEDGRQRYVADCLETEGHKIEISEEKES